MKETGFKPLKRFKDCSPGMRLVSALLNPGMWIGKTLVFSGLDL